MKTKLNLATAAAIALVSAAPATLMSASVAQAQQGAPKGWFKVCAKQEENDICNVQNIVTAETG